MSSSYSRRDFRRSERINTPRGRFRGHICQMFSHAHTLIRTKTHARTHTHVHTENTKKKHTHTWRVLNSSVVLCCSQVRDTCCGDDTDTAQCQIACEKFLAYTPSINQHAADREIVDLCMAERLGERAAASYSGSSPGCSSNATVAQPTDGQKCKSGHASEWLRACSWGGARRPKEINKLGITVSVIRERRPRGFESDANARGRRFWIYAYRSFIFFFSNNRKVDTISLLFKLPPPPPSTRDTFDWISSLWYIWAFVKVWVCMI